VRPTIAELKAKTQPESVTGRRNSEHWTADLYLRNISPYITRLLVPTSITPNGVTYLMILTGISISLSLLIPGWIAFLIAFILSQLQMLWDCIDGELARWRERFSPAGIFLDKVGHYFAEALIPIAIGIRLSSNDGDDSYLYPFLGALLATLIVINKGLNDAVHVARYFSGLERLQDKAAPIRSGLIAMVRRVVGLIPLHRSYHSVEMTLIFTLAAIFGLLQEAFLILVIASPLVTLGHLISILASNKLSPKG
jgi:phosphatidylglycerophosphate synthase